MFLRRTSTKKVPHVRSTSSVQLDSSLTSIEWLPNMQISEHALPNSITIDTPSINTVSSACSIQPKLEAHDNDISVSTSPVKPSLSYVTLIRQAILSNSRQRMTLNEIYQWIADEYPYFRTASSKWKVREVIFQSTMNID
jgi:hypothetical protein